MNANHPSWSQIARTATTTVGRARHGARDAALNRALAELQRRWPELIIAKQTLRTAMGALNFVDEVGERDREYARILEGLPAIVVETLHRWHHYDPTEAERQARRYGAGDSSVRRLMEAEREARRDTTVGSRSGRSGRSLFEEDLPESISGFSVVETGLRVAGLLTREPDETERARVPASLLAKVQLGTLLLDEAQPSTLPDLEQVECALLVAGPYTDPQIAASRVADWLLRALGLLSYFPDVALVLADGSVPTEFVEKIPPHVRDHLLLLVPPGAKS
jgi:hypothetical protein